MSAKMGVQFRCLQYITVYPYKGSQWNPEIKVAFSWKTPRQPLRGVKMRAGVCFQNMSTRRGSSNKHPFRCSFNTFRKCHGFPAFPTAQTLQPAYLFEFLKAYRPVGFHVCGREINFQRGSDSATLPLELFHCI